MRVKVCGITRPEDAELAVSLGAWALGLIFYERSPRACPPDAAAEITAANRRKAELAGVFVDPSLDELAATADALGLTILQLHGSIGPAFCSEAARRTGCKVIRAFEVQAAAGVQDADRFRDVDFHLFDTRVIGGTGETWDWGLAAQRRSSLPLILSGGLTPGNVAEGIAAVQPWAVDTASGTEAAPGVKDPERLAAFFAAAAQSEPGLAGAVGEHRAEP